MKLTSLTAALAAVLTLACASAQGQTNAAPAAATNTSSSSTSTTTTSTSMEKTSYGGTVTAVDAGAGTISVHSKKHDLMLKVDSSTTYKGATGLADVAVGDKVRGSYTKDASGNMTACSVNKKKMK